MNILTTITTVAKSLLVTMLVGMALDPLAAETLKGKLSNNFEIHEFPIPQKIVDTRNDKFEVKITYLSKEAGSIF
jgi:hypothetical protein